MATLVALPRDPRRQPSQPSSPCLAIRGDNGRDACRFASRSEATTIATHVALPREPIWQRSRSLSLHLAIQGDIHRDARRFTSRSKATSIAFFVAWAHDPCRLPLLCPFPGAADPSGVLRVQHPTVRDSSPTAMASVSRHEARSRRGGRRRAKGASTTLHAPRCFGAVSCSLQGSLSGGAIPDFEKTIGRR